MRTFAGTPGEVVPIPVQSSELPIIHDPTLLGSPSLIFDSSTGVVSLPSDVVNTAECTFVMQG